MPGAVRSDLAGVENKFDNGGRKMLREMNAEEMMMVDGGRTVLKIVDWVLRVDAFVSIAKRSGADFKGKFNYVDTL